MRGRMLVKTVGAELNESSGPLAKENKARSGSETKGSSYE
jgi:hypothetical protein